VFLDDTPLVELEQALAIPIRLVRGAADLVAVCTESFNSAGHL